VQFTTYLAHPAFSAKPLSGLLYDKFIAALYTLFTLIGVAFQLGSIRSGVPTYRRDYNKPADSLGHSGSYMLILSLSMIVIGLLSFLIGIPLELIRTAIHIQISVYGPFVGYGFIMLFWSLVVVVFLKEVSEPEPLERWLPAYSPAEWRWRPRERSPQPSPWDKGVTPIILSEPVHTACLSYALQDAGFGQFLKRSLRKRRLRINKMQPTPGTDEAFIVVLTPWSATSREIESHWRKALTASIPIIPVLLEDVHLPPELSRLNCIDARQDLTRARDDILTLLQGKPLKTPKQVPPEAPLRPSRANVIGPQVVSIPLYTVLTSAALRLLIVAIVCPMALWIFPELSPEARATAGGLFAIACIQIVAAGAFSVRRFSFPLMLLTLTGCALGTAALTPHIWPELNLTLGLPVSTGLLRYIIGFCDAAAIGLLLFVPACRRWAVGGLVLKLERVPALCLLYYPAIAALTLFAFLLPAHTTGERVEDIERASMELTYGQVVLARFESDETAHSWRFVSAPGDAVTIQLEAASLFLLPRVTLYDSDNQIVAERQSGLVAQLAGTHLQAGGTYTVSVQAAEGSRGVYRLRLLPYETSSITCGQAIQFSLSDTTPWREWAFEAHRRDVVFVEMIPIKHRYTPGWALFNPRGIALTSGYNKPSSGLPYIARIICSQRRAFR
jgi:hypothetical protein